MTSPVDNRVPLPGGELLLPPDVPRDEWLAARRNGIGSSDITILAGVSTYRSEYELWLDKTGRIDEGKRTEAMRRGQWLEPYVADFFAEHTGITLSLGGLVRNLSDHRMLATPDRFTGDGGCLEIKTVEPWARVCTEWRHGGIARYAYVQGQWQLYVTGLSHVWFVAYILDQEPQIRGPVARDVSLIERLARRAARWWVEHVEADMPPPVDLATITDEEIALRWPVAEPGVEREAQWPAHVRALLVERAELKRAEKQAGDRAKEIDRGLRVMAGDAEALCVNGRPVVTFKSHGSTSRRIHVCKGWDLA